MAEQKVANDNPSFQGKKNIYVCETCKGHIVTVDRDTDAKQMRRALLACAPLAFAAIDEEKKYEVGNSDLDNEQPVAITIRTTLGAVREARRALFVANIHRT